MTAREIREAVGVTQVVVAVDSGTSLTTVRLYEADPKAVKNPRKKQALDTTYASLARKAALQATGS